MSRLSGKVAIVTGAASGIGEAIVRRFADEGAQVVATDILDGSAVAAEAGAEFIQHDVANGGDWKRVMDRVADHYGHLDVLVNNAGIVSGQSIDVTQLESWNRVFAVNVTGVMLGTRFAIELGRWLVAEAGTYLTRVVDVKQSQGETFVVVDGGLNHQLAASGNFGTVVRRNYPLAVAARMGEGATTEVTVVGPLCTPLDRLGDRVALPPIAVGDLVAIFLAGAYGASASPSGFLGHPAALELVVERS